MKKISSSILLYIIFISISYSLTVDQAYIIALKYPQIYKADKILNDNYKDLKGVLSPTEREMLKNDQRKWVSGLSQHINVINNQVQITQDLLSYIEIRNAKLVDQWNHHIGIETHSAPIVTQSPTTTHNVVSNSAIFERQFTKPSHIPTPVPTIEQHHYTQTEGNYINSVNTSAPTKASNAPSNSSNGGLWVIGFVSVCIILKLLGITKGNSGGFECSGNNINNASDNTKCITTVTQHGTSFNIHYTIGNSSSNYIEGNNSGIVVSHTQSVVTYHHPNDIKSISTFNINTRERRHNISC